MSSTASHKTESVLHAVQRRIAEWWETRREADRDMQEITAAGDAVLHEFARDCGVDPSTLKKLILRGPHASDEMIEMMKALNIDPDAVHFENPVLYRDMQVSCSLCADKKRCHHELAEHTAAENYAQFCVNEFIMSELRAHPEYQIGQ